MDEVKKYTDMGVFCDHRTPIKLQEKFYKITTRAIMLYIINLRLLRSNMFIK